MANILFNAPQHSVAEVRPGLVHSRKRQLEVETQAKKARYDEQTRQKFKSTKQLEEEQRANGLSQAISADNKGFAMLAKMGYKQGDAIGKSPGDGGTSSKRGIIEPIGIQIKADRGGLGREAALKQLHERRTEIRRQRLLDFRAKGETITTEEFRRRQTQKAEEKQLESNLGKCQRACEKLDSTASVSTPAMVWFWPQRAVKENDGSDCEQSASEDEVDEDEIEYDVKYLLFSSCCSIFNC